MGTYGTDRKGKKYGGINPKTIYNAYAKKDRQTKDETLYLREYSIWPRVDFTKGHVRIRGKGSPLKTIIVDIYAENDGRPDSFTRIPADNLENIKKWAEGQKPVSFRALILSFLEFKQNKYRL